MILSGCLITILKCPMKIFCNWQIGRKRILITNDKEFGELIFLQKRISAGIILFRVKGQGAQEKVKLLKKLLMGYRDRLLKHFVVITSDKIRIIPVGD